MPLLFCWKLGIWENSYLTKANVKELSPFTSFLYRLLTEPHLCYWHPDYSLPFPFSPPVQGLYSVLFVNTADEPREKHTMSLLPPPGHARSHVCLGSRRKRRWTGAGPDPSSLKSSEFCQTATVKTGLQRKASKLSSPSLNGVYLTKTSSKERVVLAPDPCR